MNIVSLLEAREQGLNKYFTGIPCVHGHLTYRYTEDRVCSQCKKDKVKKRSTIGGGNARRWAKKTQEQRNAINIKRKKYYADTREQRLLERKKSYEKLSKNESWMEKRRENRNDYRKKSYIGKGGHNAQTAKRRTAKMYRTPGWLTPIDYERIENTYKLAALQTKITGERWHVDHIIPLQGKLVSGLHVPSNLEAVPAKYNIKKSNKHLLAL